MSQSARITGPVVYREGDGPNITIPEGPIEFQESEFDVTLSWSEGNTRGVTAIPLSEFHRYLASRAIQVEGQPG
ncbi:hypothetical protein [Piscinibacter gummiphilus]|uniref:Uncharacterized protein n=1 Tax=Piscinibacter gummiphilus TaxID=946333 RepID=A0ABZ0CUC1_9BURK|nr:hypothetical protein [Piscinibacter gummiphilus]WOB08559.1 hypothetical protein RXV79_00565 [Piscinibacter gummiphilus]